MRALLVVIVPPVREDHSRFAERVYQLAVQALLPEAAVEAFGIPVLPRASWIDVESLDPVFLEPSLDRLGDELGAVVGADAFGGSMLSYRFLQQGQDVGSLDGAVGVDAVALPGKLVYQIEGPQLAPSLGVVRDEVPGPDVVAAKRLLRHRPVESPCRLFRGRLGGT